MLDLPLEDISTYLDEQLDLSVLITDEQMVEYLDTKLQLMRESFIAAAGDPPDLTTLIMSTPLFKAFDDEQRDAVQVRLKQIDHTR
jgi:hypothetical protein